LFEILVVDINFYISELQENVRINITKRKISLKNRKKDKTIVDCEDSKYVTLYKKRKAGSTTSLFSINLNLN
jgi:hypothetical protein